MRNLFLRGRKDRGYSIAELMMGVGIFAVGMSIAYPLLVGDMNLYIRNFSINKSNNSMRGALQQLKNDLDMAVQPPFLMSYRVSGATGILKPLASNSTTAEAILMWVNLGPSYDMQPTATGTVTTTSTTGTITLRRRIATATVQASIVPQVGDRLLILSPSPTTAGMSETVTMDGGTISKPGRQITYVSIAPTDTTSQTFSVRLDQTHPLPATVPGNQSVLVIREVAYAAKTITDSTGTAVERQLVRYGDTYDMTNANLLIRDLDPTPQTPDAYSKLAGNVVSTMSFNYPAGGGGSLTPLSVNLPIRALDYASAIADRNLGGQTIDTSTTEFNVFLRSNPQMKIKVRLD